MLGTVETNEAVEKKEVEKVTVHKDLLKECLVLWKVNKNGKDFLTGKLAKELGEKSIIAFYNTKKKNPKSPDISVMIKAKDGNLINICSLWDNQSKSGKHYLSGLTDDKEAVIGFYNHNEKDTKKPYIRVLFKGRGESVNE